MGHGKKCAHGSLGFRNTRGCARPPADFTNGKGCARNGRGDGCGRVRACQPAGTGQRHSIRAASAPRAMENTCAAMGNRHHASGAISARHTARLLTRALAPHKPTTVPCAIPGTCAILEPCAGLQPHFTVCAILEPHFGVDAGWPAPASQQRGRHPCRCGGGAGHARLGADGAAASPATHSQSLPSPGTRVQGHVLEVGVGVTRATAVATSQAAAAPEAGFPAGNRPSHELLCTGDTL